MTDAIPSDSIYDEGGSSFSDSSDTDLDEEEHYQPLSTSDDESSISWEYHNHLPNGFLDDSTLIDNGTDSEEINVPNMPHAQAPSRESLPRDHAITVMNAMWAISFAGPAPDWASRIPEQEWIDSLRRLRSPRDSTDAPSAPESATANSTPSLPN